MFDITLAEYSALQQSMLPFRIRNRPTVTAYAHASEHGQDYAPFSTLLSDAAARTQALSVSFLRFQLQSSVRPVHEQVAIASA